MKSWVKRLRESLGSKRDQGGRWRGLRVKPKEREELRESYFSLCRNILAANLGRNRIVRFLLALLIDSFCENRGLFVVPNGYVFECLSYLVRQWNCKYGGKICSSPFRYHYSLKLLPFVVYFVWQVWLGFQSCLVSLISFSKLWFSSKDVDFEEKIAFLWLIRSILRLKSHVRWLWKLPVCPYFLFWCSC